MNELQVKYPDANIGVFALGIHSAAFPSSGCIPSGNFSGETYVRYPVKYKMFHRLSSAEWAIS